jgi:hypothetical protein
MLTMTYMKMILLVKNEEESDNDSNNEWVTKSEFYI